MSAGSRLRAGAASCWALSLAFFLPVAPAAGAPPAVSSPSPPVERRAVVGGLGLHLAVDRVEAEKGDARGTTPLRAGETVRVRLRVTDAIGAPVSRLYPAGWMDLLPATRTGTVGTCQDKVEAFVGGSLLSRPEVDLNVYYVLTLNRNATLSVVDPLFGFGGSRLLALVHLERPGFDWVLARDGRTLWVSMPDAGRVAVVDTASWKIRTHLEAGPRPGRLALSPDGRHLWVAGPEGVTVLDADSGAVVTRLATGAGPHDLAFSDDGLWAWIANAGAGTVSVLDLRTHTRVRDLETGREPVSLAWSPKARTLWIAHRGDGAIVALDERHEIAARLSAPPGLAHLRTAPDGRLVLAVNPDQDLLHVIDTASRRLVQTGDLEDGPERITFTDELAYIRHRGSDAVLMIPWKELGKEGAPVPVADFPGGQNPPGAEVATPADGIVQAPGASAILVANPKDDAVYYYKEGMAAPMGHFKTYGRTPRAVLAVDRSLREVEPGVYETLARLGRAGRYDLALFANTPRLVHCFAFEVAEDTAGAAARARAPVRIEPLDAPARVRSAEARPLRFRLSDPATGRPVTGLTDLGAYTFLAPGTRQSRREMREVEPGIYELSFRPAEPGVWYVFLESSTLDLESQESPTLMLEAD